MSFLRPPSSSAIVPRIHRVRYLAGLPSLLLVTLLVVGSPSPLMAREPSAKEKTTPAFWQRDPDADFEDEGRMHCAPVAIADGLVHLSRTYGWEDLVPGTDHESQIELVGELAEAFQTDPKNGGTDPDRILTGLQAYVTGKGYAFKRLEVMTWRPLGKANRKLSLGAKPGLAWMRKAAANKEIVMAFNFGWYEIGEDGNTRKGGHWVAVTGVDKESDTFYIRNPALPAKTQLSKTAITVTELAEDFVVIKGDEETDMAGYFQAEGPALPLGENYTAVLDAVIVFSLTE